ncbi:MAG: glutathione S-transferase family protein [Rubrivivax sp.]
MTLKIYGIAASRAFRNLWCAEELGLPYEHVKISFNDPAIKEPAFLALNPNGAIPVIDDNGVVVFESLAINLYLAERYGAGGLGPSGFEEEAQILQWTFWAATEIESQTRIWFQHTVYLPEAERRPEAVAAALAAIGAKLAIADGVLAQRPWLVAGRFTVADLNLAAVLVRLKELGGDACPNLSAWHARCMARPAAQRALAMRAAG